MPRRRFNPSLAKETTPMPGAIIIGAGPGIGVSVARRFARAGFPIGVVARSHPTVDAAVAALAENNVDTHGATADAADESSLRAALDVLVGQPACPTWWSTTQQSSSGTRSES